MYHLAMNPASTPRPFRFGVTAMRPTTRAEWVSLARKAEDLGFAILTTPDHLTALFPPFAALMTVAEATSSLRVGTLVLNNDLRHPALVAREAAAVDVFTSGRFELGIGAGHARPEYEESGIVFEPGTIRVARLAESVQVIKGLWAGTPTNFVGEHYQIQGHLSYPNPVQEPHPPLLIGGNARSLLRLAAREADIVGFTGLGRTLDDGQHHETSGFTAAAAAERLAVVRKAAAERFASLELHALVQAVVVTDYRERASAELAQRVHLPNAAEVLGSPFLLVGTASQMADSLRQRRAELGMSYFTVFEQNMDALQPVVAILAGG